MRKEVNKIIEKAKDFYEDAVYLFKGESYEAVVNRCYYAMFRMTQALVLMEMCLRKPIRAR